MLCLYNINTLKVIGTNHPKVLRVVGAEAPKIL